MVALTTCQITARARTAELTSKITILILLTIVNEPAPWYTDVIEN